MIYLKEIIKGVLNRRKLPGLAALLEEHQRWKKYQHVTDVFKYEMPWITIHAIDFLDQYLKKDMRVFEYGGGGSTLFFASRVKELVTIEHNKEWFDSLKKEMTKRTQISWTGNFIEPETSETLGLSKSNPDHYFSEDVNFSLHTFKKYASSIDQFPDEYFDVVLIDGRARPSCMKHSLNKVKKNGLLILDNTDRSYYLEEFDKEKLKDYKLVSEHFGPTPYISWFTQTNIWKKVNGSHNL